MRIWLCIAALASIATSAVQTMHQWSIDRTCSFGYTAHVVYGAPARYQLHSELTGWQSGTAGVLAVDFELSSIGNGPGTVHLELRSLTFPDDPVEVATVWVDNGSATPRLEMPIWLGCESETCVEDHALVVSVENTRTVNSLYVSGEVTVTAGGDGPQPADAAIVVSAQ